MNLSSRQALERLDAHDHGVLATLHPTRGADVIPVVYATVDGHVGVPIDLVKPKSSTRLQRERNLDADPRATLLIEHWDHTDWSKLWWVRAQLRFLGVGLDDGGDPSLEPVADELAARLAERHEQYADRPFARLLVFRLGDVTGWVAEA